MLAADALAEALHSLALAEGTAGGDAPAVDSFNPLANADYRSATDFVEVIDSIFPRRPLTKDTGLD